jgi:hypothetical protein
VSAVEIKCPLPGKKFVPQIHYSLPVYYVSQVMLEMAALQCPELLFVSYTEQSTCVFKVTYSKELGQHMWDEIQTLYGERPELHPPLTSRLRNEAKQLKNEMQEFAEKNVQFLCEVPSIKGFSCAHEPTNGMTEFCTHPAQNCERNSSDQPCLIEETLMKAKTLVEETYELCRKKATEVLVFMMSDLDRFSNVGCGHSLPVAFGLQGPSLKTDCVNKMLRHVLQSAEEKGLHPLVFSSDGQIINLHTKDLDGKPLTVLQKAKMFWEEVKKIPKPELVKFFQHIRPGQPGHFSLSYMLHHVSLK